MRLKVETMEVLLLEMDVMRAVPLKICLLVRMVLQQELILEQNV